MSPSFTLMHEIVPARMALYFFNSLLWPDESLYKNKIWPCDTNAPSFTFHFPTFTGFSDGTEIGTVLSAILNGYCALFIERTNSDWCIKNDFGGISVSTNHEGAPRIELICYWFYGEQHMTSGSIAHAWNVSTIIKKITIE